MSSFQYLKRKPFGTRDLSHFYFHSFVSWLHGSAKALQPGASLTGVSSRLLLFRGRGVANLRKLISLASHLSQKFSREPFRELFKLVLSGSELFASKLDMGTAQVLATKAGNCGDLVQVKIARRRMDNNGNRERNKVERYIQKYVSSDYKGSL